MLLDHHIQEQNSVRGHQQEIVNDPEESILSFAVRFRSGSQQSTTNHDDGHPPLGKLNSFTV